MELWYTWRQLLNLISSEILLLTTEDLLHELELSVLETREENLDSLSEVTMKIFTRFELLVNILHFGRF